MHLRANVVSSCSMSATCHESNSLMAWLVSTASRQHVQNFHFCWAGFRQSLGKRSRLAQLACHDRYGIQKYMTSLHMVEPPVVEEWGETQAASDFSSPRLSRCNSTAQHATETNNEALPQCSGAARMACVAGEALVKHRKIYCFARKALRSPSVSPM